MKKTEFKPLIDKEIKGNISNEVIPWINSPKLRSWVNTTGGGWKYYMTTTSRAWTWSVTFQTWFKPKLIQITATYDWWAWSWTLSNGSATSVSQQSCIYSYSNPDYWTNITTSMIIQLRTNSNADRVYWEITNISWSWFTLDFDRCDMLCLYNVVALG